MPPDPERVRIETGDGVASVRLTRGDKHNGLDWTMFESLNAALDDLEAAGEDVRAVVLSGEGPSFCAGLDFKSFMSNEGGGDLLGQGFAAASDSPANFAQRVAYGWRELEVPVVAALQGNCLGGGLQIALGADIRIAAPGTRMSVMEIRYGLIPDMSLSRTLPRLVRDDVARELTYTGRVVEVDEALALGLVTRIADDPLAAANELAAQIASASPSAIRSAKRLWTESWHASAADGLALEEELQRALIGGADQAAAVGAALGDEAR
ncbi:crotonase/enoyl-CoA hydratase family protein [soil metagenome]